MMRLTFERGALEILLTLLGKQKPSEIVSLRVDENGFYLRAARNDGEVHVAKVGRSASPTWREVKGVGTEARYLAAGFRLLQSQKGVLDIESSGDAETTALYFRPDQGGEIKVMTGEHPWMPMSHRWGEGVRLGSKVNMTALAALGASAGSVDKNVICISGRKLYAWAFAGATPCGGVVYPEALPVGVELPVGMTPSLAAAFTYLSKVGQPALHVTEATVKVLDKLRPQALMIEAENPHGRISVVAPCINPMSDTALTSLNALPDVWSAVIDKEELLTNLNLVTDFLPVTAAGHKDGDCDFSFRSDYFSVISQSAAGMSTITTMAPEADSEEAHDTRFSLPEVIRMVQMVDTDGVRVTLKQNPKTGVYGFVARSTDDSMVGFLGSRTRA